MTKVAFVSGNKNETILFAFLQNRAGKIIAFPREFISLMGLDINMDQFVNSNDIFDYSLEDSSIQSVRHAGPKICNLHGGSMDLLINDEKYILAVGCMGAVEWHLVLVAKESDMLITVEKARTALNKSLETIWKDFVLQAVLILAGLTLLAVCVIRLFISPITQFIQAIQNVSSGDFLSTLNADRKDEIGLFANAYNLMLEKLRRSKKIEKDHAMALEDRIRLRTRELEKSNADLKHIKDDQKKIIAKRTAQLKRLNEHLVFSEESQRKAIASDLHDSVTQTLAMSIFIIKNIQESNQNIDRKDFSQIQGFLEQAIQEIRSLIYQLSPPVLDDFDIEIALGFLIEETNVKHKSQFEYINNIEDLGNLNPALKVTLYRAVSELINNILKHAGTKKGEVEISMVKEKIWIRVEDHGNGFDVETIKNSDVSGFGLHSLKERMENFQGQLLVASIPGKGTKNILIAPVILREDIKYGKS